MAPRTPIAVAALLFAALSAVDPVNGRAQELAADRLAAFQSTAMIDMVDANDLVLTSGSGIVLATAAGRIWIATAAHVVERANRDAAKVHLKFAAMPIRSSAWCVASVPDEHDVALISAEAPSGMRPLVTLVGDATALTTSAGVYAVGRMADDALWSSNSTIAAITGLDDWSIRFASDAVGHGFSGGGLFDDTWTLVGMTVVRKDHEKGATKIDVVLGTINSSTACKHLLPPGGLRPPRSTRPPSLVAALDRLAEVISRGDTSGLLGVFEGNPPAWITQGMIARAAFCTTRVQIQCATYSRPALRVATASGCRAEFTFTEFGRGKRRIERWREGEVSLAHTEAGWAVTDWKRGRKE